MNTGGSRCTKARPLGWAVAAPRSAASGSGSFLSFAAPEEESSFQNHLHFTCPSAKTWALLFVLPSRDSSLPNRARGRQGLGLSMPITDALGVSTENSGAEESGRSAQHGTPRLLASKSSAT